MVQSLQFWVLPPLHPTDLLLSGPIFVLFGIEGLRTSHKSNILKVTYNNVTGVGGVETDLVRVTYNFLFLTEAHNT